MRGRFVRRQWQPDPTLHAPRRYRRPCSYDAFVPDLLLGIEVSISGETAALLSEAESAIGGLNATADPALAPLARLLLRTESIASSRVEGMQVDVRTLARAEAAHDAGRNIGPEAAEVLGNIDAMQFAIERASGGGALVPQDLLDIHRVLLERAPGRVVLARLRGRQNWIGGNDYNPCGAAFVPPPPEEIGLLLDDLCRFCNEDALPPLAQAAIAHAQFETIHPFDDGNGRTGRALVQVLLRKCGLAPTFVPPISVALAQAKERYIRGLTLFREDEMDAWLEIFATATTAAATLATTYLGRLAQLQDEWREKLRQTVNPRADAAAWTVIDVLPGHPIISVAVAVAATGRTKPAVNNAMAVLTQAGVLIPVSKSRRNRAWEADGLLDLIGGLESGTH